MSLRDLANGQNCMARIPTVCNFNPETTVLAHLRIGGVAGMGQKPPDTCAIWACSCCHDVIDGRAKSQWSADQLSSFVLMALLQQLAWYDKHEILLICTTEAA